MSDFLDVQYQVNFLKETPPEHYKLMNVKQKVLADGYINGEKILQAYEEDVKISEDLTNFYFVSDRPVTLTFENEDGDSFTFEKMQQFSYFCVDTPITVTITNTLNTTVKVVYAGGKQKL